MGGNKPERLPGESKKEYKSRVKQLKKDEKLVARLRKMGVEPDPDVLARMRGEEPPPPPIHERPIPAPKSREEGGMRADGRYVRRSTTELAKVEAHLDTIIDYDRTETLVSRFKEMYNEDLDVPEGYELIPERGVHRRPGPPSVPREEPAISPEEALELAYGEEEPAYEPPPEPEPVADAEPEPYVEPEMEEVPVAAEVEAELIPEEVPEAEPEPEEVPMEAAPEVEPEPEVAPAVAGVAGMAGVAGVAGASEPSAVAGATAAPAVPAGAEEVEDVPQKRYNILDARRIWKIGPRAMKRGNVLTKILLGIVNILLYIGLMLAVLLPVWVTVYYASTERKARKKQEEAEWTEYYEREGYDAEGYPPEGGYYGEGDESYDEEAYGY